MTKFKPKSDIKYSSITSNTLVIQRKSVYSFLKKNKNLRFAWNDRLIKFNKFFYNPIQAYATSLIKTKFVLLSLYIKKKFKSSQFKLKHLKNLKLSYQIVKIKKKKFYLKRSAKFKPYNKIKKFIFIYYYFLKKTNQLHSKTGVSTPRHTFFTFFKTYNPLITNIFSKKFHKNLNLGFNKFNYFLLKNFNKIKKTQSLADYNSNYNYVLSNVPKRFNIKKLYNLKHLFSSLRSDKRTNFFKNYSILQSLSRSLYKHPEQFSYLLKNHISTFLLNRNLSHYKNTTSQHVSNHSNYIILTLKVLKKKLLKLQYAH